MLQLWKQEGADWQLALDPSLAPLSVRLGDSGRVLAVGLGEAPTAETVRRAAAKAVKTIRPLGAESAVLDVTQAVAALGAEGLAAAAFGGELVQYQPEVWKAREDKPFALYLTGAADTDAEKVLSDTGALVRAVSLARDLANRPSNKLSPVELARQCVEAAQAVGIETEVLDEHDAEALGMGAFLAVGTSSGHPPRLIILRYKGGPAGQVPVALVGKGVCYDSGGYTLKTHASLKNQKGDMAGSAAVLGAITALAANRVSVNVTAVIPAVENRISPDSFVPGDVLTSMSGRTIEIGSTDAEGRLVLADAVTYAIEKEGCGKVVDIATLTGSMANALGPVATGYLCNDEDLNAALLAASGRSGELFWRFPTFPEYRKMIDGPSADLYNTSEGCGGICGGLFIGAFAGDRPWLHLDIAGTAAIRGSFSREYQTRGATGVGVTTLYELCRELAK